VRSQLMLRWFARGHKSLTVMGVEPGDGASLFAANLAVVFSQLGENTLLGVGLCMLAEMFDRRVRSETDLSDMAEVPVLGAINWNPPKRKRFSFGKPTGPRQLRLN
jgi:hypothetical protein